MSPTLVAVAGQALTHRWAVAGTSLPATGFYWFGFLNLAMLAAFFMAALRRERPSRDRAGRGTPARRGRSEWTAGRRAGAPVLASDGEREAAGDLVADAIAEGRLTLDEGVDRIDAVYSSRARADLARLVADLPTPPTLPSHRSRRHRSGLDRFAGGLRCLAAVTVVGAVVVQAVAGVWALWPVAVGTLSLLQLLRRR